MDNLFRGFASLLLIFLISVSLVSGLSLTASVEGNGVSSSTHTVYGATIDDFANQHIGLNPEEGTLSNAFSGSGSLPYNSLSISDTKGNYAEVHRSVSGEPGVTRWTYDWNTYMPHSSNAGYGVGARLWLTASNAYSISGGSSSSNKEGDNAQANTNINSNSLTASSLSDYYTEATAFTNAANAYQRANSASGNIQCNEFANNYEGDEIIRSFIDPSMDIENGQITSYVGSAKAKKDSVTDSVSIGSLLGNVPLKGIGARNRVGDNVYETVRSPVASSSNAITNYKATVYANSAKTTGTLKADASGAAVLGGTVFYREGGISDLFYDDSYITLQSGSLRGYNNAIATTSTMAKASQGITSTYTGRSIKTVVNLNNKEGDRLGAIDPDNILARTQIINGQLSRYADKSSATPTSLASSQSIKSASGSSISLKSYAENVEGDQSATSTQITNGQLSGYSDESTAALTTAKTKANIKANGDSIDVQSHAENRQIAYEGYRDESTGNWMQDNYNFGGADFQVVKSGSLTTNVKTSAFPFDCFMGVTGLPTGTKTAIMLEPFASDFVNKQGATDTKTTVFKTLVDNGYATTRYTDSAASKVKFSDLYKYNVVQIISHMGWYIDKKKKLQGDIALTTSDRISDRVYASDINYRHPQSQSLVILAGCEGFQPGSYEASISSMFQGAKLSAGFEKSVAINWMQDYTVNLFQDMGTGMTFSQADSNAWNNYMPTWCNERGIDPSNPLNLGYYHIWRLTTYGNTGFKL
jgi:hypothetical protein